MKITKLGHCCLLIEVEGKRIVTDPGLFTTETHAALQNIDIVLITHEHSDHIHLESLKTLMAHNEQAVVVTNAGVGALLDTAGIAYTLLEGEAEAEIKTIALKACDGAHAEIAGDFGIVQNTGYFIHQILFYPGDAYTVPQYEVAALALPVSGPWAKVREVVEYAQKVVPKQTFPVHDGLLNETGIAIVHRVVKALLRERGVAFTPLRNGEYIEISS